MKKLRFDEAHEYAQTAGQEPALMLTAAEFAGFVVGVDWKSIEQWPIPELWNEYMNLITPDGYKHDQETHDQ